MSHYPPPIFAYAPPPAQGLQLPPNPPVSTSTSNHDQPNSGLGRMGGSSTSQGQGSSKVGQIQPSSASRPPVAQPSKAPRARDPQRERQRRRVQQVANNNGPSDATTSQTISAVTGNVNGFAGPSLQPRHPPPVLQFQELDAPQPPVSGTDQQAHQYSPPTQVQQPSGYEQLPHCYPTPTPFQGTEFQAFYDFQGLFDDHGASGAQYPTPPPSFQSSHTGSPQTPAPPTPPNQQLEGSEQFVDNQFADFYELDVPQSLDGGHGPQYPLPQLDAVPNDHGQPAPQNRPPAPNQQYWGGQQMAPPPQISQYSPPASEQLDAVQPVVSEPAQHYPSPPTAQSSESEQSVAQPNVALSDDQIWQGLMNEASNEGFHPSTESSPNSANEGTSQASITILPLDDADGTVPLYSIHLLEQTWSTSGQVYNRTFFTVPKFLTVDSVDEFLCQFGKFPDDHDHARCIMLYLKENGLFKGELALFNHWATQESTPFIQFEGMDPMPLTSHILLHILAFQKTEEDEGKKQYQSVWRAVTPSLNIVAFPFEQPEIPAYFEQDPTLDRWPSQYTTLYEPNPFMVIPFDLLPRAKATELSAFRAIIEFLVYVPYPGQTGIEISEHSQYSWPRLIELKRQEREEVQRREMEEAQRREMEEAKNRRLEERRIKKRLSEKKRREAKKIEAQKIAREEKKGKQKATEELWAFVEGLPTEQRMGAQGYEPQSSTQHQQFQSRAVEKGKGKQKPTDEQWDQERSPTQEGLFRFGAQENAPQSSSSGQRQQFQSQADEKRKGKRKATDDWLDEERLATEEELYRYGTEECDPQPSSSGQRQQFQSRAVGDQKSADEQLATREGWMPVEQRQFVPPQYQPQASQQMQFQFRWKNETPQSFSR